MIKWAFKKDSKILNPFPPIHLDAIIAELSPKVIELAPKIIPNNYKIPLLSIGPDVDVRETKLNEATAISGEFYVEDVRPSGNSEMTRRLVFQNIIPTIQTEVLLKFG